MTAELIEAEILAEQSTGKPYPVANAAEGVTKMTARIAHLSARVTEVQATYAGAERYPTKLVQELLTHLKTARDRLAHYETQIQERN